jgi:hypothetical protein
MITNTTGPVTGAYTKNVTALRAKKKFGVNTTSTTDKTMGQIKGANKIPTRPVINFTREAWVKQCYLVEKSSKEVGWFAMVDYDEQSNEFTITEIVIPKQEVNMIETDIGKEDLADAALELIQQGKDTSKLYAWFHSHVNMGVSPSGQDEYQVEDFLEDLVDHPSVPAFIRGIQNKKGDLKLDVYYMHHGIVHQNVDFYVIHDDDPQWYKDIDAEIAAKVKEQTFLPQNFNMYNKGAAPQKNGSANGNVAQGYGPAYGADFGVRNYDERFTPDVTKPAADHPVDLVPDSTARWWEMETVFLGEDNVEVMQDVNGKLFVVDERGEVYNYDEYVGLFGEVE